MKSTYDFERFEQCRAAVPHTTHDTLPFGACTTRSHSINRSPPQVIEECRDGVVQSYSDQQGSPGAKTRGHDCNRICTTSLKDGDPSAPDKNPKEEFAHRNQLDERQLRGLQVCKNENITYSYLITVITQFPYLILRRQ